MTAAAGYVRVSTEEQAREGYSLAEQEERIRALIEAKGWRCVDVFADEGVSGSVAERPGLERLLDAADGLDRVVVFKLDRLSRKVRHLLELFECLEHAGVEVVSLTESIDTTTASGRMFRNQLAVFADFEREQIGERTRLGLQAIARTGRQPCGAPPLGYKAEGAKKERRWVVDEAEAEVVRRIFSLYVGGMGTNSICRTLNAEGVRTRRGAKFVARVVIDLVANPAYVGMVRLRGEVSPGAHEAIVDEDTFHLAQELRQARRETAAQGRGRPPMGVHIFTNGLLRCGECGSAMSPRTNSSNGWQHYRCVRAHTYGDCPMPAVSRKRIDRGAAAAIGYAVDKPASVEAIRAEAKRQVVEAVALLQTAERELVKVQEATERVEADYLRGGLSSESYDRLGTRLAGERAAAEAEVARHRARVEEIEEQAAAFDAEGEFAEAYDELYRAIAGQVAGARGLDALRAALIRAFSKVELRREDGVLVLVPEVRAVPQPLWLSGKQTEASPPSPPGTPGRRGRRSRKPEARAGGGLPPRLAAHPGRRARA